MFFSSKPDLSRIELSVLCRLAHRGQYTSGGYKEVEHHERRLTCGF